MKHSLLLALLCSSLSLTACQKKTAEVAVESSPSTPEITAAKEPATEPTSEPEQTEEQQERAKKQALMDYAIMEDSYINDPKAQWVSAAKVSSIVTSGSNSDGPLTTTDINGKVDGTSWTNNNQEIGFDWAELEFAKPVFATEVRLVIPYGEGVEAISKIELQDTTGKWNTIWSGISEQKQDQRGNRTWFIQKFDKTSYQVKAVKYTIANNLSFGYKRFDAAQLVGE